MKEFSGCWPTMITPYTKEGKIDYKAVEKMVDWYIEHNAAGIFAVCQSSEMFFLDEDEKLKLAKAVVDRADGRIKVIASGHTSSDLNCQIDQLGAMSETGVDAVILVSNRLAEENESDDVLMDRADDIFSKLPNVRFGLYECPYPYRRLVSLDFLKRFSEEKKLVCIKDVCCSSEILKQRIEVVRNTDLALLDANTATLLDFLRAGGDGYSGVMGNFHIDLYTWLYENFHHDDCFVEEVNDYLTLAGAIEARGYPMNAKYHFCQEGIPMEIMCRNKDISIFNENNRLEEEALYRMEKAIRRKIFK